MRRVQQLSGAPGESRASLRRLAQAAAPAQAGSPDHVEHRDGAGQDNPADAYARREGASRSEALAVADFRHIVDPRDVEEAHALARRLARRVRARLVRRRRAHRHGRRLDLRRTIHRNVCHGGTPVDLVWRRRKIKPRCAW
jgi:uncharacterized protein with von Willebrand factor type A (vWA) domain